MRLGHFVISCGVFLSMPCLHAQAESPTNASAVSEASSGEKSFAEEMADLLKLIDSKQKKYDPENFSEIDLGQYRITHEGTSDPFSTVSITFKLYAVLPADKVALFNEKKVPREKRLRDTILSIIHETPYEEFDEPDMITVKNRLLNSINKVLEIAELRNLAFSELSFKLVR
jgi:hypothetical protein